MRIAAPVARRHRDRSWRWYALVTAFAVPAYLVPSPVDVAQTLVADWELLSARAPRHAQDHASSPSSAPTVIGTLVAFAFVQSRLVEASFFPYAVLLQVTPIVAIAPLIIIWVKNTAGRAGAVRDDRRDLPDHLQHDARPAQREPGSRRPLPDEQGDALADARAAAHPERRAVLLRRPAHLERARADRRGRRGVRRRHRRPRRGARLPDPAGRLPAQHPAALRRAASHHRHRRRAVPRHGVAVAARARRTGTRASCVPET